MLDRITEVKNENHVSNSELCKVFKLMESSKMGEALYAMYKVYIK